MAATLTEILLAPEIKPQVVRDCYKLIDQQISEMSGVSGAAVKLAFKAVNTFMPGHAYHMAEKLLPDFVGQLEPYWAAFNIAGGSEFGDYLAKHGDEVAGALLSVTDAKAASSDRPTVTRAYGAVRGGAAKHIQAALPRVGDLVQKYEA
jgi:hypothetical protein